MKRKRFLAVLTAASLSASMALTAMPVFAGDVVSVEASDAAGYSSSTVAPAEYQTKLDAALKAASIGAGLSSATKGNDIRDDLTIAVTSITTTDNAVYAMSNYKITSFTAPSFTTTATGGKIVMPVLTIQADLTKTLSTTSTPAGTVTFTVDATALTKSEKVAAIKAVLEGLGGTSLDPNTDYSNGDNTSSVADKIAKIFGGSRAAAGTVTAVDGTISNASKLGTIKVATSEDTTEATNPQIAVSQGTVTPATKSAAGSEVINATVQIKYDNTDREYDTTLPATQDQRAKETASYTATIPKLAVTSEDSEYQAKVAAALKDVTFTNEDLKYVGADGSKTELTTSAIIGSGDTQEITTGVWKKIGTALNSIGIKEEDYKVTLRALTKASHKADGSVQILVDQKRDGDSKDVQYATVTVPITHADDTVAIGDEISAKIVALVKAYIADSKDITPTVEGKAAQKKEITAKLQTAVENALSDKLDGTDTIASEIDKVEVEIPDDGFTASTASTNGSISKANVTVTFKNDAPAGTALTDPGKGFWAAKGTSKTQTVFEYDNAETHHAGTAPGVITLYKVTAVSATSLTLPEETPYNTLSGNGEIKVTPSFTPAASNNYVIRWTLSDNSKFKFKASASYDDYDNAKAAGEDGKITDVSTAKTAFLANDGIALTFSGNPGDTATLTAELIDSDGLVAAKASTTLKAYKGFSDVQNTHDYAYNAINYLSSKQTVSVDGKDADIAVIDGVGNNLFNPDGDVTRAQFVTFLYRLDQTIENNSKTATAELASDSTTGVYLEDTGVVGNATRKAVFTLDDGSTRTQYFSTGTVGDNKTYTYKSYKTPAASTKFIDVDANAYYAKAVDWAVANGITSGKTDTTFDPNGKVTRAEAVTFMYRYFAANQSYNAANFTDVPATAYYANAVGWASANGITQGKTSTVFAPKDTTSRKEAAAFIYRAEQYNGRIAK